MLHLLRLRPTPDDLKRMNGDGFEPHSTHVFRSWTAFLRESAPPESLDELNPKDATRVEKRRRLLTEIYEIAEMEEEYLTPGPGTQCIMHDCHISLTLVQQIGVVRTKRSMDQFLWSLNDDAAAPPCLRLKMRMVKMSSLRRHLLVARRNQRKDHEEIARSQRMRPEIWPDRCRHSASVLDLNWRKHQYQQRSTRRCTMNQHDLTEPLPQTTSWLSPSLPPSYRHQELQSLITMAFHCVATTVPQIRGRTALLTYRRKCTITTGFLPIHHPLPRSALRPQRKGLRRMCIR